MLGPVSRAPCHPIPSYPLLFLFTPLPLSNGVNGLKVKKYLVVIYYFNFLVNFPEFYALISHKLSPKLVVIGHHCQQYNVTSMQQVVSETSLFRQLTALLLTRKNK